MRVLFVAPWVPGSIRPRSLALLRELAKAHSVKVVVAAWSENDVMVSKLLPAEEVQVVRLHKLGASCRAVVALLGRSSLQQAYVDSRKLRGTIRTAVREFNPHLVYFNVARSAQFGSLAGSLPKIVDLDEFRSGYYDQVARSTDAWWRRAIAKVERDRLRRAEADILRDFDSVLVSSPNDLRVDEPKITLVRSSAPAADGWLEPTSRRESQDIVFVGRQDYRANEEAISWFVNNVLPDVVASVPAVRVIIVGDRPTKRTQSLANERVIVTGRVADVADYYTAGALSIAPITTATGVQMKLIESLSYGTPTIASVRVAEGAGISHERECLVADSREEWIEATIRLLKDKELGAELATRGRAWVRKNHSVEAVAGQFWESLRFLNQAWKH